MSHQTLLISQTGYAISMFIAMALTVAGMFTPGWRTYDSNIPGSELIEKELFELHCPKHFASLGKKCEWWDDMPSWNKVVFLAISFAILIQLLALVWAVLAFVLKSHRRIQMCILIALSAIICFLLAIVITNFATNDIATAGNQKIGVGYSYYITCGGFFFSFVTIIFGIVAARSACDECDEYTADVYHW